jgi:hypothetical protein
MSGGVGQIRSAGKGGPEVVAPVGNRPERSEWDHSFPKSLVRKISGTSDQVDFRRSATALGRNLDKRSV